MILKAFTCKPKHVLLTVMPLKKPVDTDVMVLAEYLQMTGKRFLSLKIKKKTSLRSVMTNGKCQAPHISDNAGLYDQ